MSKSGKARPGRGFRAISSPKRHAANVRLFKLKAGRYGGNALRAPNCEEAGCDGTNNHNVKRG